MLKRRNIKLQMSKDSMSWRRWCEFVVLLLACLIFGYFLVFGSEANAKNDPNLPESFIVQVETNGQDFSKFQHTNQMHVRLPCLLCHKREDNSPTPKLSGHIPCSSCHTAQFADNQNSICTICHTATGVKRFPALRSFNVQFDHAKHVQQTNCATCHKSSRQGVAFSIPSGANAHPTCYQCHKPQTPIGGQNIGSCGTCHQIGSPTRVSEWAKAYRTTPFSHLKHNGNQNLNCSSCHSVKAGASRGNQVTAPLASMHFAPKNVPSCSTCHNNKRAFGGDDFWDCRRCHRENSFKF